MKEVTENYLRMFMRSCQQFWSRQWCIINGMPQALSYEKTLVGTYADMKQFINKERDGETITETDLASIFNTEFSDSWEKAKKIYVPGTIIPQTIIVNGDVTYRNEGLEGLMKRIENEYKNK